MAEAENIALRSFGQRRKEPPQGDAAEKVKAHLTQWGYKYPQDIERPPPGMVVYTFKQHVVVPPARQPADAPDDPNAAIPPGGVTRAQVFTAQPFGILVVKGICPAPKDRTAVEFGYAEYRGCIETDGRNLFCSPGTGSTARLGTQQGVGNFVIIPKGVLQVLLWNPDRCSEAKWSLKWSVYALTR